MSARRLPSAAAVALLSLLACAPTPVPRLRFYRLAPDREAPVGAAPAILDGVLVINRFTADTLLGERPIVYGNGDSAELHQHRYDYWVEPPPDMLEDRLAAHLRARRAATVVARPEMRLRPDYVLRGRVRRFERVVGGGNRAVIETEITVTDASDRLVWTGVYKADVAANGDGVRAAVAAFDRGVADILDRFTADLARSNPPVR